MDPELRAWRWLMSLPRLPFDPAHPKRDLRQFQLRVSPALPNHGPADGLGLVEILARFPGSDALLRGHGNTLSQACKQLHGEAWRVGIQLPFVEFHGDPRFADSPLVISARAGD